MHSYGDYHDHVSDHGHDDHDDRDGHDHDRDDRGHDVNVYHVSELHNILYVYFLALNLHLILTEFSFNEKHF